jgi:N-acetylmuramoyl-L-alanine amidase
MSIINYTTKELDLLARLMRAEAVGEGELGMLMVGNVGVNRVLANCLDFPTIRTVTNMIYQSPGGFTGINSPLFQSSSTTKEKRLAEEVLMGRTYYPATHALWFYAPRTGEECRALWFNQRNSGRYKNHCFYRPDLGVCPQLIR